LLTPVSNPGSTVDEDDGFSAGSSVGSWDFAIEELESTGEWLEWDPIAEARVVTPMPFDPTAEASDSSSDC